MFHSWVQRFFFRAVCFRPVSTHAFWLPQQGNTHGPKTKKRSERAIAGSDSGKRTKLVETGRGRNGENRPELIHAERGERWPWKRHHISDYVTLNQAQKCLLFWLSVYMFLSASTCFVGFSLFSKFCYCKTSVVINHCSLFWFFSFESRWQHYTVFPLISKWNQAHVNSVDSNGRETTHPCVSDC